MVKTGGKHWKIETIDGRFVTIVPRHRRLKRELVRGVVARLRECHIDIDLR